MFISYFWSLGDSQNWCNCKNTSLTCIFHLTVADCSEYTKEKFEFVESKFCITVYKIKNQKFNLILLNFDLILKKSKVYFLINYQTKLFHPRSFIFNIASRLKIITKNGSEQFFRLMSQVFFFLGCAEGHEAVRRTENNTFMRFFNCY